MLKNAVATFSLLLALTIAATLDAAELKLDRGDRICLVGNALGERMQHQNYWETLLHQRFADKELVVRNLCFPGDEPMERIRSMNFGDPDVHLKYSRASVVMYLFGFNESFGGQAGLDKFRSDLTQLVKETLAKDYSGKGAPQIVLVSPIAFEDLGDPNLPDGQEHNQRLGEYTAAMRDVALQTGVVFVD
ncbi:MAG: SGNH/GDSL hydrolase family protein, partial [Planctomycetota bacterium]